MVISRSNARRAYIEPALRIWISAEHSAEDEQPENVGQVVIAAKVWRPFEVSRICLACDASDATIALPERWRYRKLGL